MKVMETAKDRTSSEVSQQQYAVMPEQFTLAYQAQSGCVKHTTGKWKISLF